MRTVAMRIATVLFFAPAWWPAAAADVVSPKAGACEVCHGMGGNSTNPAVPSLAGQPQQFITTQLVMFREGNRKNAEMSPFAANLSNADLRELAAYFSAQPLAPLARTLTADKAAAGKSLTQQYFCVNCHGQALRGQMHIPRLAGQQTEYLRVQLRGFKASTRFDMDGQMSSAAQPLTLADIDVLAEYLSALQ
jgi:cytochrome c553